MRATITVCVLVSLSGTSLGEVVAQLRYETSVDGGPWTPGNNSALPGSRVEVRAMVTYVGPGTSAGLCQIVFQPTISNWTGGDILRTNAVVGQSGQGYMPNGIGPYGSFISTPPGNVADLPGVYGRISPWAANFLSSATYLRGHTHVVNGVSYLRIAQNQVTNWFGVGFEENNVNGVAGVSIAQGTLDRRPTNFPPPVLTDQDLIVFKFGFDMSMNPTGRNLAIDTPANGIGRSGSPSSHNVLFFASTSEIVGSIRGDVVVQAAHLNLLPAPAAASILATAGLFAGRRRRPVSIRQYRSTACTSA